VLTVDSADEAVLLVSAGTDYIGFAGRNTPDPLAAPAISTFGRHRPSRTSNCALTTSPTTAATSTA
jgi:hypothetical protein